MPGELVSEYDTGFSEKAAERRAVEADRVRIAAWLLRWAADHGDKPITHDDVKDLAVWIKTGKHAQ
jgi:hypothetical protein